MQQKHSSTTFSCIHCFHLHRHAAPSLSLSAANTFIFALESDPVPNSFEVDSDLSRLSLTRLARALEAVEGHKESARDIARRLSLARHVQMTEPEDISWPQVNL